MKKLYRVSKKKQNSKTKQNKQKQQKLKLKKVRKITRPFRYDLNQIPYDYTVEVTNIFKGLDLIDKSV